VTALELHTSSSHGPLLVSVIGPLNRHTVADLREHLRRLLDTPHHTQVDLDLRACTHVDIEGLLALEVAFSAARSHGTSFRLTDVPPLIARMIDQHHLAHLCGDTDQPATEDTANTRVHRRAETGTAAEVPDADAYEQQLPADPDQDEADPEGPDSSPAPLPLEADPADVDEQHRVVPFDAEDEGDDRTTLPGQHR
jgi:anti-anti-sigma factor